MEDSVIGPKGKCVSIPVRMGSVSFRVPQNARGVAWIHSYVLLILPWEGQSNWGLSPWGHVAHLQRWTLKSWRKPCLWPNSEDLKDRKKLFTMSSFLIWLVLFEETFYLQQQQQQKIPQFYTYLYIHQIQHLQRLVKISTQMSINQLLVSNFTA